MAIQEFLIKRIEFKWHLIIVEIKCKGMEVIIRVLIITSFIRNYLLRDWESIREKKFESLQVIVGD